MGDSCNVYPVGSTQYAAICPGLCLVAVCRRTVDSGCYTSSVVSFHSQSPTGVLCAAHGLVCSVLDLLVLTGSSHSAGLLLRRQGLCCLACVYGCCWPVSRKQDQGPCCDRKYIVNRVAMLRSSDSCGFLQPGRQGCGFLQAGKQANVVCVFDAAAQQRQL